MAHYSLGQRPLVLASWAKKAATELRASLEKEFGRNARPIFVYRGMSGIAHATALSMEWERRSEKDWIEKRPGSFAYVRKPEETSHGDKVEIQMASNVDSHPVIPVFVDDFVSSGDTRRATMSRFYELGPLYAYGAAFMPVSRDKFIQVTATTYRNSDVTRLSIQSWEELKPQQAA